MAKGQALTSSDDTGDEVDTVICEATTEREQVEETLDHPAPLLKTAAGGRSAGWGGFLEAFSLPGLDKGRYGQVDFSWHPESELLPCSKAAEVRWFVTTQRS